MPPAVTDEYLGLEFKGLQSDRAHSSLILTKARTYLSLRWRRWTAFHFPAEMVPQPVNACTLIRAFLNYFNAWNELLSSQDVNNRRKLYYYSLCAPAFLMKRFPRLWLWTSSRTKTGISVIRVHGTHASHGRIWRPIRVSASSWLKRFAMRLVASSYLILDTYVKLLPSMSPNASVLLYSTRNLTISGMFAVALGSLFHDFTVQTESKFLYCTPSEVDILFNILDLYLSIHVKRNVYAVCLCWLPSQTLSPTKWNPEL